MGILEIATVIFGLVNTFGPIAERMFSDWYKEVGENPTPEQWEALRAKIKKHDPDSY